MDSIKVLLVDDEIEFVSTLAQRLEIRGYQSSVAHDGEQALTMVAENSYDVLIVDLMLPGMTGLEVLQEMNRRNYSIPVILCTGRGSTQEGMEGMRSGAFDYLMKPVDINELMAKIDDAAGRQ
jgi:DNA-binding response OmpR family regulator